MKKHIVKVTQGAGLFRVAIPTQIIKEKGWENVTHVEVQGQWGDRLIIERVATDEETEKKNCRG